jgi:hypothetical protein
MVDQWWNVFGALRVTTSLVKHSIDIVEMYSKLQLNILLMSYVVNG